MDRDIKVSSSWVVPHNAHGLRADQYLKRHIGRISRSRVQRIIRAKDFCLDHQDIKISSRVRSGQLATLSRFAPDHESDLDGFKVEIIFEDEDLLVLNKPSGLSVHPTANCLYRTLTYWLRQHYPHQRINPCHRLDKETSGIIICAKNSRSESEIKTAFMHSLVSKTYLAIVNGQLLGKMVIARPLALQGSRGLVAIRMIEDQEGKPSITKVSPLSFDPKSQRSLVACKPITGRQHQIRAHLSLCGHAIVGDKLYGHGDEFFDSYSRGDRGAHACLEHHRHALHAARVAICFRRRPLIFRCPLPEDLAGLIEKKQPRF